MSGSFWEKKLANIAQPPTQAPAPASQQQGAWWQAPAVQTQPPPQQPYGYPQEAQNPALRAQMPGQPMQQFQQSDGSTVDERFIQQLLRVPAEDLTQEQMELLAEYELATKAKYNQRCPNCDSSNFAPQGTKIGTHKLGSDKCFECGASSSTFTSSPEPALGGRASSKAPYREVRQIDTGGGAGSSMYLKMRGIPNSYQPRGG